MLFNQAGLVERVFKCNSTLAQS